MFSQKQQEKKSSKGNLVPTFSFRNFTRELSCIIAICLMLRFDTANGHGLAPSLFEFTAIVNRYICIARHSNIMFTMSHIQCGYSYMVIIFVHDDMRRWGFKPRYFSTVTFTHHAHKLV